ncbi:Bug family tripartite tricarboxylate transporter substrate binding protein [Roseomonas sp. CCTCC AB2023176]|uniref:Bug family tripartite tricarboxylate transporter substrate binding protein n=1 Tax=Roseomonas sp. CCTCC AB2023176 TaxID=3342640 RepID=UPI0035D93C42
MTRRGFGGLALAGLAGPVLAQTNRPISLIVPYAPGGGTDIAAREFANGLTAELGGQNVVVDNRAGAAGYVGSLAVARSRPDGTTLLYAVGTNVVIAPHLQAGDRVVLADALTAVAQTSSYQYVLVANPKLNVGTLQELIAYMRSRPRGSITFSSSGVGGNNHLAGVLFAEAVGVPMEHISYRGTAPALMDVVGGSIDMNFSSPPPAIMLVRDGRVKALAVTGERRMPQLPDVPTLSEAGLPGLVITGWHGLFAPNGVNAALLDRYEAAAKRAMATPRFLERLANEGLDAGLNRPRAAFGVAVREESAFWARKVPELGLRATD